MVHKTADPLHVLRTVFGYEHFRLNQEEVVRTVMSLRDAFVVMPTGGGKSLCYQVPALCMEGMAVVVSPLIALMKDQVDSLRLNGVEAACLNSTMSPQEQARIVAQIRSGELKLLYVAPERLIGNEDQFFHFLRQARVNLFAIDEAHCISQWGHDFRPEYLVLNKIKVHFPDLPVVALTATADAETKADILAKLSLNNPKVFGNSFDRPNIHYTIQPKDAYYHHLTNYLRKRPNDSGIIYCLSKKSTDRLASDLREDGFSAEAYHAGLEHKQRQERQDRFLQDKTKIIVATVAFGMGINKSNVRFVVHADLPKNIEGYYQETGRAGRDGLPSDAVLYYSYGDVIKLKSISEVEGNPEQTKILAAKLQKMVDLCETKACRRQFLLNYFGESAPDRCGACDNCNTKVQFADATLEAQKVLSTVARLRERFGAEYVANILIGSKDKNVFSEHKSLSVYGVGSDKTKAFWAHYIKQLSAYGYLSVQEGEYRVLKLNDKSREVLFKGAKAMLPPYKAQAAQGQEPSLAVTLHQELPYEAELFESLRTLRATIAAQERVPPYVVLSDSSLLDMATYLPTDIGAMAKMSGFGDYKLQRYGASFLNHVRHYTGEKGLKSLAHLKKDKPAKPTGSENDTKERDSETKQATLQLFKKGLMIDEIATARNLAATTVETHLAYYVSNGTLHINTFLDDEQVQVVRKAVEQHGPNVLRHIKESLPEEFTFGQIKMVIAWMKKESGGTTN